MESQRSCLQVLRNSSETGVRFPTRREFLQLAATGLLAATDSFSSNIQNPKPVPSVPSHLPARLTICYYGWQWITTALPSEAFGNLAEAIRETKDRGFNCIRAEMGLNWMFDLRGNRRGKIKFTNWIPGLSGNLHCVDAIGGGEHDVFERVMRLFELAEQHGVFVIMTSWEYQDAISQLDHPQIRTEILAVPYSQRLPLLARQYDHLLTELKKRGLHKRIAQVEIINELNQPPLICSMSNAGETTAEWVRGDVPSPSCSFEEVRALAENAISYLRTRHPDLLFTVDGLVACRDFNNVYPRHAQVADHHVYCDGVTQAFWSKCDINAFSRETPPDPARNSFLRSVLKPDITPWSEFVHRARRVRQVWWGIGWLYANLDNSKFDRWCIEHFSEYEPKIRQSIDMQFNCAAKFAREKDLPLIVDEGFILYPPLRSRFVTSAEGRRGEEIGVNAAIASQHWGIMPTGYFRPDTPTWRDEKQCSWIGSLNQKILRSV